MPACPKCGISLEPGVQFCPSCGSQILSAPVPVSPTAPTFFAIDRAAVSKIKTFAVLGIIGLVLGLVVPTLTGFTSLLIPGTQAGAVAASIVYAAAIGIIAVAGFILGLISILRARSAFRDLSTVDRGFDTPAKLTLGLFAAIGIFIVAFIVLIAGVAAAVAAGVTAGSPELTGSAVALLLAGLGLFVVGGISWLIGTIGLIMGLWRVGERYSNTLIKVGGILYIIPFLNVIAPILTYIGANEVQGRLPVVTAAPPTPPPSPAPATPA